MDVVSPSAELLWICELAVSGNQEETVPFHCGICNYIYVHHS